MRVIDLATSALSALVAFVRRFHDHGVVLAYAAFTGALVVGFTLLAEAAAQAYQSGRTASAWAPWIALAWTPALTVAILWWTRCHAQGTQGSGIPQVVRALEDDVPPDRLGALVSLRLALHKVVLVSGGMLAGLSIGREGPTVQVGAGAMLHARRWLTTRAAIDEHDLMVAGAAAGIAAAFNTPLGGIVFAFEQLTRRRGVAHSALVVAAIVLAGLVAVSAFGNHTYFGRLRVETLSWALLGPGLLVAVFSGLAGGLFSRLLVTSLSPGPGLLHRWRSRHPLRFAAGCALAVAVIGLVADGTTAGAGYAPTRALLDGQDSPGPLYTGLKFIATWLSAWSGVPAGVFAPSLAIGAGIGHDIAAMLGTPRDIGIALIALGMVGFLAATTQGPITAFIIVMEMVAGQSMVLSLMACALVASGVSRAVARPMYTELAAQCLPPADPPPARPRPAG